MEPSSVRRREFLQGFLAAALAAPAALSFSAAVPITRKPARVLVVGAGLSGMAAALELRSAGFEVTVLEASPRPGGRVHTLREPFSDGLYAEAIKRQGFPRLWAGTTRQLRLRSIAGDQLMEVSR